MPQREQCAAGNQAAGIAKASGLTGTAHEGFANLAEKGGGEAAKRVFAPLSYTLATISGVATFVSSIQRGEPVDVAAVRAIAPIGGSLLGALGGGAGGTVVGGLAGSEVPIVGNAAGAILGGAAGATAGGVAGEKAGDFAADEYAKVRGYAGCD